MFFFCGLPIEKGKGEIVRVFLLKKISKNNGTSAFCVSCSNVLNILAYEF